VSIVVGVAVFATGNSEGFGWTSYAPLDPASEAGDWTITFSDGAVLWTWSHAIGAGLVVLGLLVLAGLVGWFLGRRPR
jgi:heme/copper-type cytochrome/quinol oxidase subunit 1